MSVDGRRFAADERGASAVEFALLLPVLVAVVLGALQLAWGLHCAASVRWALDGAARDLLIRPSTSEAEVSSRVREAFLPLGPRAEDVEIAVSRGAGGAGQVARAVTTYHHRLDAPFLPAVTLPFKAEITVPLRTYSTPGGG